ncbi:MAG: hypothetical protein IPJ69_01050 [Deltaproteobacteria bacterium]|nr:MAG: hypothetical protein IPJ69_01050 [Deltaproteobacteria bacterium]
MIKRNIILFLTLSFFLTTQKAKANDYTLYVNSAGSGTACSSSARCSLQEAMRRANAIVANDTLTINLSAEVYTINTSLVFRNPSNSRVVVNGDRPDNTVIQMQDGLGFRVVLISSNSDVTLSNLRIRGGYLAYSPDMGSLFSQYKGAGISIQTDARLTLNHVWVTDNRSSGSLSNGTGICNEGYLRMDQSVVQNNNSTATTLAGGGILNTGQGSYSPLQRIRYHY